MTDTCADPLGTPLQHRARKGGYARRGNTEGAELADRDLRASVLAKRIKQVVDAHPPLTAAQRLALAGLLVSGDR